MHLVIEKLKGQIEFAIISRLNLVLHMTIAHIYNPKQTNLILCHFQLLTFQAFNLNI